MSCAGTLCRSLLCAQIRRELIRRRNSVDVCHDIARRAATGDHGLGRSGHGMEDLKDRAVRGGLARLCGQALAFALRLGFLVVMARLLDPDEFRTGRDGDRRHRCL